MADDPETEAQKWKFEDSQCSFVISGAVLPAQCPDRVAGTVRVSANTVAGWVVYDAPLCQRHLDLLRGTNERIGFSVESRPLPADKN